MPPVEEFLEECPLDVPPGGEGLAVKSPGEHVPRPRVPVVHVGSGETEGYNFTAVVARQAELEAVTPSRRTFPVRSDVLERLVEVPPGIVAGGDRRAVHEADARAFAERPEPHGQHHAKERTRHKLDEPVA